MLNRPNFGFGFSLGFISNGHGCLNPYLHKRGLSHIAECTCGWNSVHVLTQCPLYEDIRYIDGMGLVFVDDRWTLVGAWKMRVSFKI